MGHKQRRRQRRNAAQSVPVRPQGSAIVAPAARGWTSPITLIGVPLTLLVTFAAFSPVLDNQLTNWDDQGYITDNASIRSLDRDNVRALFAPSATFVGNYQPLTILSLALNYHFAGFEPWAYLATNLALHLLNTLLVFVFFLLLAGGRAEIALIVSLFFGIHPMHVESVAWASARKDVLYALFFLLSLISYLGYLRPGASAGRRVAFYLLTTASFLAALLSKSAAVVLPVVLLLIDYLWKRPIRVGVLVEKLPLFALSVVFGLIAIQSQQADEALGDLSQFSWLQRITLPCYGIVTYLRKLLVPADLSAFYPYPRPEGGLPPIFGAAPFLVLGLAALVVWSRRRTRVVVFGAGLFLVCIALVLQLVVNVGGAIVAERYTYLAYLGPLFIVATAYGAVRERPEASATMWKVGFTAALAISAAVFAYGTWRRSDVWQDSDTLWSDVIRQFPDSAGIAYNNRGDFAKDRGRHAAAMADFERAIAIHPTYADPYNNRGNVHFALGQDDRAIEDYTRALERRPGYVKAYANRGAALVRKRMYESGLRDFERALELDPEYPATYLNRAQFYIDTEQFEKAVADLDRYMLLDSSNADAYYARAIAKRGLQLHWASLADFSRAIDLQPAEEAQLLLSRSKSFQNLGRWDEALADARRAARMGAAVPADYLDGLERSRELGRDDDTLARLRAAVASEPDERSHRSELAKLLVARNELAEAEGVLRDAVSRWRCDTGLQVELADLAGRSRGPAGLVEVLAAFVSRCPAPPEVVNDLAYLLATARDAEIRDEVRALELAERAVAAYGEHPLVLDTLAVAYAANGRFDEAVAISQRAVREGERLKLPDDAMKTLERHYATLETGSPVLQ